MFENKVNLDQIESKFKDEKNKIEFDYKQNKEKAVDYIIDNLFKVDIELPSNISAKRIKQ